MCALFAATHPDRTLALVTLGAYARRNWAPDYPIGRRPEQDGWLRPTAEQWGRYAAERFLAERAPSVAADEEAIEWYTSYLVARREPVGGGGDHRHERGDRRAPGARPACACRRSSSTASRSTCARRAATWASGCPGARIVELPGRRPPAVGGRPGRRARRDRALPRRRCARRRREPGAVLTTVLEADLPGVRAAAAGLGARALPRPRARRAARPHPRELRRPRPRRALRDRARRQRPAAARRHPHRRVRAATTAGSAAPRWRSPPSVAQAAAPGEILATSTVQDLVAGSGIDFAEHGTRDAPAPPRESSGCLQRRLRPPNGDSPLGGFVQQHQPWVRASAPKRRSTRERGDRGRRGGAGEQPLVGAGQPRAASGRRATTRGRSRRPARRAGRSPRTRTSVRPRRCRRRARAGCRSARRRRRAAPRRPRGRARVARPVREVVDRAVAAAGDQQPAAVGRTRRGGWTGAARGSVHSTFAVSASSTVTVPSVAAQATCAAACRAPGGGDGRHVAARRARRARRCRRRSAARRRRGRRCAGRPAPSAGG